MLKAALLFVFAGILCLPMQGQEDAFSYGGVRGFGFSSSYSPDSSHIFIGMAQQRRTWTLSAEYTHRIHTGKHIRFDYEGSLIPFYQESDPTVTGTIITVSGVTFITPEPPVRVIFVNHGPVGTAFVGHTGTVPIYATYGRETTNASAVAPLGGRISAFPRWRVQPSFSLDLGIVFSQRDIPVDQATQLNYMFSFGPGVQIYSNPRSSVRLEYIYRHISNAHEGYQNPGVDQGVVRITFSRHQYR